LSNNSNQQRVAFSSIQQNVGNVVIIKTGSTFPALAEKKGDFEDWIIAGMEIDRQETIVVDVTRHSTFPDYPNIAGIVITGSHAMVTERQPWSERTAKWLRAVVDRRIPVLGICYGHQLLADALDGTAGNNPNGREFGTINVHLNATAKQDPLLSTLPEIIQVHVSHTQSVLCLPPDAQVLASSKMDKHQAFVIRNCAWGVQFHPEFDAEILREYIKTYQHVLREQGSDPEDLLQNCQDTPYGSLLLQRFREIIQK
jgi:GMP synthase (glutamine-hydrolysing)